MRGVRTRPPAPPKRGWGTAIGMLIAGVLLIAALLPFAAAAHVVRMAHTHDVATTDAIVVLGAAQLNGTPTPVLANRLDHAKQLYEQGVAPTIVTVGGKQPGDVYTEAESGRDYLINAGVPEQDVVAVQAGNDTLTSLTPVSEQLAAQGLRSVTIVSDPAHMARSAAIADRLGMTANVNGTSVGDGAAITPEYVARETVGYLYFVLAEQWSVPQVIPDAAN